jgi:gamma-tubulin complex component 2
VLAQELCAPELPAPHGAGSDDDSGTESDSASQRARDDALGLGRGRRERERVAPARGGGRVLGGEVLATLADLRAAHAGDPAAHALFSALLRAAGAPYVRILRRWVTRGELADAHGEVLVREDTSVRREGGVLESVVDEYWERRYTVRAISPYSAHSFSSLPRYGGR